MVEGTRRSIEVRDTPSQGVQFFLDLLFTGTSCLDFDHSIALAALDLAHRWQVNAVVTMLEGVLQKMLSDESFGSIAEMARLKGLTGLADACLNFADNSAAVQRNFQAGTLPQQVLDLLGQRFGQLSSSGRGQRK